MSITCSLFKLQTWVTEVNRCDLSMCIVCFNHLLINHIYYLWLNWMRPNVIEKRKWITFFVRFHQDSRLMNHYMNYGRHEGNTFSYNDSEEILTVSYYSKLFSVSNSGWIKTQKKWGNIDKTLAIFDLCLSILMLKGHFLRIDFFL